MGRDPIRPLDVARRLAGRGAQSARRAPDNDGSWQRETFTLPRDEARAKAREAFSAFPKAAYMTEIEWWRELDDGRIASLRR